MGKKRTRVPGEPRNHARATGTATNPQLETPTTHTHTLEQDVLAQRDTQVATERRQQERQKRRKTQAESADEALPFPTSTNHAVTQTPTRQDAREAGLRMWRNAHERRTPKPLPLKHATSSPADDLPVTKILQQAREQRAQIRLEEEAENLGKSNEMPELERMLRAIGTAGVQEESDDDDEPEDGHDEEDLEDVDFLDAARITEEEEHALQVFNNQASAIGNTEENPNGGKIMLADIILAKIEEKAQAEARAAELAADPEKAERDAKVTKVYNLVGNIMSKYRSGKVPKAFKVIPKVADWQHLLYLTRPHDWSPAAMFVATRLLSSNLSATDVTEFYTDVLLPKCLEDISENKKLNYHLYQALAQAIYKPDAFCKGILFPICEDEGCTLRQALIISSVVSKVSIPMLHSAAALLYISGLPFRPTTCLLITALVEKKYALPYRVIDAIVDSFVRMDKSQQVPLPLIWHQCLLAFAQRYKMQLTAEQKGRLKVLMRVHTHHAVTPEIRRELFSARNRGELMDPDANTIARSLANAAAIVD